MITNLKNLMTKTATVGSAKLLTPADRIGLGLAVATYPASVLSPQRLDSESNPGGFRQEQSSESMREHRPAMATAKPPAGSAGRDCSGSSAHRWLPSLSATKRQPATGRLLPVVGMSRMSFPVATMPGETNPTAAAAI